MILDGLWFWTLNTTISNRCINFLEYSNIIQCYATVQHVRISNKIHTLSRRTSHVLHPHFHTGQL